MSPKTHPTPSRRERERARQRPLIPADRKEANRKAREALARERERARLGYKTGEERYLPARDRGVQKRFARDYVDARTSPGEFILPVMLLTIMLMFFPISRLQYDIQAGFYIVLGLLTLDGFWLGFRLKSRIRKKFGEIDRGVIFYAVMRLFQIRRLRLPKPQVKRGQFPK